MHPLDLAILAAYAVLVMAITAAVMRQTRTGDDLFLAGRSLGWGVIGLSLFASNISSTTLIGLAGAAYADGIAVANYEWMAGLVLVFMAVFVIPVFLRQRISTVPGYLGLRFDGWCQRYRHHVQNGAPVQFRGDEVGHGEPGCLIDGCGVDHPE